MNKDFKALGLEVFNVGRRIKSTKIRYVWRFEVEEIPRLVEIFVSKLSGKRTILLDGEIYCVRKKNSHVFGRYLVKVEKVNVMLSEVSDNQFEMFVDKCSFEEILAKQNAVRSNKNDLNGKLSLRLEGFNQGNFEGQSIRTAKACESINISEKFQRGAFENPKKSGHARRITPEKITFALDPRDSELSAVKIDRKHSVQSSNRHIRLETVPNTRYELLELPLPPNGKFSINTKQPDLKLQIYK